MGEKALKPFTPRQEKVGSVVIRWMSRLQSFFYRKTGGRFGSNFIGGAPVLLLTTIGRKSGQPRTTPLIYLGDGDKVLLVASKGGMSDHPLWYYNLVANPAVEIQVGNEQRKMTAHTATPDEKSVYWPKLVALYKDYADYQARTERDIPVVVLSPRAGA